MATELNTQTPLLSRTVGPTTALVPSAETRTATTPANAEQRGQADAKGHDTSIKDTPSDLSGEVSSAVKILRDYVQSLQREFQFTVDEATGRTVIKIVDGDSNKVVRQIPQEEILALVANIKEARGLLLKEEA